MSRSDVDRLASEPSMAVPLQTHDIGDTLTAAEWELKLYEGISGRSFSERVAEKRQRRMP